MFHDIDVLTYPYKDNIYIRKITAAFKNRLFFCKKIRQLLNNMLFLREIYRQWKN